MFRPEFPPEDAIRRIIHAGLLAPFAAAAVGNSADYFRRFFVMKKGSQSMNAAAPLVMAEIHRMSENLHEDMKNNLRLREQAIGFAQRLAHDKKTGSCARYWHSTVLYRGRGTQRISPRRAAVACTLPGKHVAEGNGFGTRVPDRIDYIGDGTKP